MPIDILVPDEQRRRQSALLQILGIQPRQAELAISGGAYRPGLRAPTPTRVPLPNRMEMSLDYTLPDQRPVNSIYAQDLRRLLLGGV